MTSNGRSTGLVHEGHTLANMRGQSPLRNEKQVHAMHIMHYPKKWVPQPSRAIRSIHLQGDITEISVSISNNWIASASNDCSIRVVRIGAAIQSPHSPAHMWSESGMLPHSDVLGSGSWSVLTQCITPSDSSVPASPSSPPVSPLSPPVAPSLHAPALLPRWPLSSSLRGYLQPKAQSHCTLVSGR